MAIILNHITGLFSDVLNYVLRISKSSNISQASTVEAGDGVKSKSTTKRKKTPVAQMEGEDSSDVGTVCVECFKFLKALAMDYVDVQERYGFYNRHLVCNKCARFM